jgi:hypothetical protein
MSAPLRQHNARYVVSLFVVTCPCVSLEATPSTRVYARNAGFPDNSVTMICIGLCRLGQGMDMSLLAGMPCQNA